MHQLKPRESVVLATDYDTTVAFYRDVLGFEVTNVFSGGYHYTNLKNAAGIQIGIAMASEMKVEPVDREKNTVLLQFEVEDVPAFMKHVEEHGGSIQFGPDNDTNAGFWYGAFRDPEGNPMWVVDSNCP